MLFGAYRSNPLRELTAAHVKALAMLDKSAARKLTGAEKANFRNRIARNLMDAYDSGERDPTALKSAAVRVPFVSRIPR